MPEIPRLNDPIKWMNLIMLVLLSGFCLLTLPDHPMNWGLLVGYGIMIGMLFYHDRVLAGVPSARERFPEVYPFLYLAIIFESLGFVLPYLDLWRADSFLRELDRLIFGVDPTLYLEAYSSPILTEVLTVAYLSYFALPFCLLLSLYRRGNFRDIHEWGTIVILTLYVNYLFYFVVPAKGPRFFIAHSLPLDGLLIRELSTHVINFFEPNKFDIFPSAHTSVSLAVLYGYIRYHKKQVWLVSIFVIGILISTVYLRYHYVVDVIAGVVLLALTIPGGHLLHNWFEVNDQ